MHSTPSRRLATPEAAQYLGLAKATLDKDRVSGRMGIPYYRLGRRIVYDQADLDAWLDQHRRKSTSDPGLEQEAPADG